MKTTKLTDTIRQHRTGIMGIAMLCIMLFHQSWIWGKVHVLFFLFHVYGHWGVDIFFFVSGFGLYYSLNKNGSALAFYKRRLLRLLPLCITCGLVRYAIDHVLPVGRGGYPTGVHEVTSDWTTILSLDKWFIAVILAYYLVMPLLRWAFDRFGYLTLCLVYLLAIAATLLAKTG
ncbi:MAG: acyltransferase family protein [Prevotella sp.]|nr:acyltransferase family protein [Prevotella sp.]